MRIRVYEKTSMYCQQCMATKRYLDDRGHEYEVLSIEENPDTLAQAKAMGITGAPIVTIADDGGLHPDESWGGFDIDQLNKKIGGERIRRR